MEDRQSSSVLTLVPPRDMTGSHRDAMHIAVEATRLAREVRGIGRYVRAVLPRLVASDSGVHLTLYAKNSRDATLLEQALGTNDVFAGRLSVRPVREMRRAKADVFWYPWNHATPVPEHGAVVPTIHDVVPLVHPDTRWRGWQKNLRWKKRYAATAARATLIIADSQFSADEIHRVLGVPYERMRVVLLAADDVSPVPRSQDAAALAELGVKKPYVLAVGAADRRKNLGLIVDAMPIVRRTHPDATLVLAGPRKDLNAPVIESHFAHTLGFVSDAQLAALYRNAEVLVQASTYEGFGLPVLEAMQHGTPVISTRVSSLPEVGGDAAIWIDPQDFHALGNHITSVMSDSTLRAALQSASTAQASKFSWNETARQTLQIFREAADLAKTNRR